MSIAVTDSVSSLRWTCTRLDFCDPATSRLIVLLPGGVGGLGGDLEFLLVFLANDGNSFGDVALGSSPLLFSLLLFVNFPDCLAKYCRASKNFVCPSSVQLFQ